MKTVLSISLSISIFLSSCCSIINGRSQDVGISSSPTGANVIIDGQNRGVTPLTTQLTRDENHTIVIEKEGYVSQSATMTKSVSGWIWGNLLFGGLVGLVIDCCTGAIWTLDPENVNSTLTNAKVSTSS